MEAEQKIYKIPLKPPKGHLNWEGHEYPLDLSENRV